MKLGVSPSRGACPPVARVIGFSARMLSAAMSAV
jgi:hypothetical protein